MRIFVSQWLSLAGTTPLHVTTWLMCAGLLAHKLLGWWRGPVAAGDWRALAADLPPLTAPIKPLEELGRPRGKKREREVAVVPPPLAPTVPAPRAAPLEPAPGAILTRPSEVQLVGELNELAEREITTAQMKARNVLKNASDEADEILEAARVQCQKKPEPKPVPAPESVGQALARGAREGHALGMRRGELEAVRRIEELFLQMERLFDESATVSTELSGAGLR